MPSPPFIRMRLASARVAPMNTLSINFRLLRVLSGFPTADDVFLPAISLPAKPPEDPIRAGVAGRRELEAVRESLVLSEAPKAPMSSPRRTRRC